MSSSSSSPALPTSYQRTNCYTRFLPYDQDTLNQDAADYLEEIKANLAACVRAGDLAKGCSEWFFKLHKYFLLYGLHFTKEDHVMFVKIAFEVFCIKEVDPFSQERIGQVLETLLKKKYLLNNSDLELNWRTLFDLYYYYEESSFAARYMVKPHQGFKTMLKSVIKFARSYFSEDSTAEMLKEWRPLLCPPDRSISVAMRYFSLFLPTTSSLPPEKTYKLWFDEFMNYWETFSNAPAWEVELFQLFSRLAFHNVGRIDWTPYLEPIMAKIMNALNLPCSFGSSGVRLRYGLANSSSFLYIARFVVSAIHGGRGVVLGHLRRILLAVESFYQPANINSASEGLHLFVNTLCQYFVRRVHVERYNKKYPPKTPQDKRLTDGDICEFVQCMKPIAFNILFGNYEEDRRVVFNHLASLRPDLIIPELLSKFSNASATLTEPHRLTACVAGLYASARPLVETQPLEVMDILMTLLPGIDVNDIWKCSDIFILLSDLLEIIWIVDFSSPSARPKNGELTEEEEIFLAKTRIFEEFVATFTEKCFTLIENSSREQTRHEADVNDEVLNEEEMAVDAAIGDTFQKMMLKASPELSDLAFQKVKRFVQSRIFEASVAGYILACMCKVSVSCFPQKALSFFVPHLCQRIETAMTERADHKRVDMELQFCLLHLSEAVSIKGVTQFRQGGGYLVPHLPRIKKILDLTLTLAQKDEYEHAMTVLENCLFTLTNTRPLTKVDFLMGGRSSTGNYDNGSSKTLVWDREAFRWCQAGDLDKMTVEWYVPGEVEMAAAQQLLEEYMETPMQALAHWMEKKRDLEKEEVLRNLRQIVRIVQGSSEVLASICEHSQRTGMRTLKGPELTFRGKPVRKAVIELAHRVQAHLLSTSPDDTDSLLAVISLLDLCLRCFGVDEDELYDVIEEHKSIKNHRENKMIRSKRHYEAVLMERISIQKMTHVWMKNMILGEDLPFETLKAIFQLCVSHYSEVRQAAQDLLQKVLSRTNFEQGKRKVIPMLTECLKDSPDISHQMFKGALYILFQERFSFFYDWKAVLEVAPSVVMAQHSDRESIVDLLKDFSFKTNRIYASDNAVFTLPIKSAVPTKTLLEIVTDVRLRDGGHPDAAMAPADSTASAFRQLESILVNLLSQKKVGQPLHWRHEQMALGLLLMQIVPGYDSPSPEAVEIWLRALVHDHREVRLMAFQALEGILKLVKTKAKRVKKLESSKDETGLAKPGIRPDNEWLQYQLSMSQSDLEKYWEQPFSVKPWLGFHSFPDSIELRVTEDPEKEQDNPVVDLFRRFFGDKDYVSRLIGFCCLEHKRGEDYFSMDRALFYGCLFRALGADRFMSVLAPHISRLAASHEESDQRAAAELALGASRGFSRAADFKRASDAWQQTLLPAITAVLTRSVTQETLADWEAFVSGATNKIDPNRVRWLFETLLGEEATKMIAGGNGGAFREAAYLRLLNKAIMQNYRVRDLYQLSYDLARPHLAHPYDKVRIEISKLLATLFAFDLPYRGSEWNMGTGFPRISSFIEEVLPKMSLNMQNPDLNGIVRQRVTIIEDNNGLMEDDDEESEGKSSSQKGQRLEEDGDEEKKEEVKILQTVSMFVCQFINSNYNTVPPEFFKLLPFLCQFNGTEMENQEVGQSCLKALCYLSVCVVPSSTIDLVTDMLWKLKSSESWKAKISMLEFVQVFYFTNFAQLCGYPERVRLVQDLVVSLLSDDLIQVRQKAATVLGGLIHSQFITIKEQKNLVKDFRSRIRAKMQRDKKSKKTGFRKTSAGNSEGLGSNADAKTQLARYHSGVLGLCAVVEAYPFEVPEFVPPIIVELEAHLHGPQPIPKTIKKTMQDFKRTHQDNWEEHKQKFTEDQLLTIVDLLISPNYYA